MTSPPSDSDAHPAAARSADAHSTGTTGPFHGRPRHRDPRPAGAPRHRHDRDRPAGAGDRGGADRGGRAPRLPRRADGRRPHGPGRHPDRGRRLDAAVGAPGPAPPPVRERPPHPLPAGPGRALARRRPRAARRGRASSGPAPAVAGRPRLARARRRHRAHPAARLGQRRRGRRRGRHRLRSRPAGRALPGGQGAAADPRRVPRVAGRLRSRQCRPARGPPAHRPAAAGGPAPRSARRQRHVRARGRAHAGGVGQADLRPRAAGPVCRRAAHGHRPAARAVLDADQPARRRDRLGRRSCRPAAHRVEHLPHGRRAAADAGLGAARAEPRLRRPGRRAALRLDRPRRLRRSDRRQPRGERGGAPTTAAGPSRALPPGLLAARARQPRTRGRDRARRRSRVGHRRRPRRARGRHRDLARPARGLRPRPVPARVAVRTGHLAKRIVVSPCRPRARRPYAQPAPTEPHGIPARTLSPAGRPPRRRWPRARCR